ncbi:hypothetical protein HDU93_000806, partial [Gonapodya sp. JEL0774]
NTIKFAANQRLKIGGDLDSWKTVVSIFALQQGVHEYIQGTVPKPEATGPGSLTVASSTPTASTSVTPSASASSSTTTTLATSTAPVTTTVGTSPARASELDAWLAKD